MCYETNKRSTNAQQFYHVVNGRVGVIGDKLLSFSTYTIVYARCDIAVNPSFPRRMCIGTHPGSLVSQRRSLQGGRGEGIWDGCGKGKIDNVQTLRKNSLARGFVPITSCSLL